MTNENPKETINKIIVQLSPDKLVNHWAMAIDNNQNPVSPFSKMAAQWNILGGLALMGCFEYGNDGNIYVFGPAFDIVQEAARRCHGETLEWIITHLPTDCSWNVLRAAQKINNQ